MTTITKKRRSLLAISAFALMLAMGAAGCGDDKPSASPSADSANSSALKYSQCMRDQGLSWFPDPGEDGGLQVSVPEGTDQATVDKAEEACKQYDPSQDGSGQFSPEDVNKVRQMAQCVRDKGFPNYPDPDSNGAIHIDEGTTGISPNDPAFQKAVQECQKFMPRRGNS